MLTDYLCTSTAAKATIDPNGDHVLKTPSHIHRFHTGELAEGSAQQSTGPSQVAVRQLGSLTSL